MKYSWKNRLAALLTAALLLISWTPDSAQAAENGGVTVCLHYDRPDGNYEG